MYTLSDLRLRIGETSNYYLTPTKSEKINSEYIYLHTFNNVLNSTSNIINLINKENIIDFNHTVSIYFENYSQDNADVHCINMPSNCTTEIMINRWYDFCKENNLYINDNNIKIRFISDLIELYNIKDEDTKEEYKLYIKLSIIEDNLKDPNIENIDNKITIIHDPNFKDKICIIDLYAKKCW